MNKLALAASALLVLTLLALPALVGSVTEARVRERVAAIDASPNVGAEVTSFDRGWFRSRATIELELVPPNAAAQSAPLGAFGMLPIALELAHGPIAVLDGVHFGWSKATARADRSAPRIADLEQTLGVPYLFEFRSRTSYRGNVAFDADAPPFELPISEALLTFSGATFGGTFAAPRLAADAQLGSVTVASPTGAFSVSGLQATLDNELRSQYVMPGQAAFSIASISATGPVHGAVPTFAASNVRVRSNVEVDASGSALDMRVNYDVDSLELGASEITAGTAELRVRKLDVAALEAYGALVRDAAATGSDPVAVLASLGPQLERALKAGPSLAIDPLRFRHDGEPFEGRIEITADPSRLPAAGISSVDSVLAALWLVDVSAEARFSKTLATRAATMMAALQLGNDPSIPPEQLDYMAEAQAGLMLTMLAGQGMLVDDGDSYRTSLDYTDGALTLNVSAPLGLP